MSEIKLQKSQKEPFWGTVCNYVKRAVTDDLARFLYLQSTPATGCSTILAAMSQIPERFTWAASILRVHARHQILEIGCGAGLLAQVIAEQLSGGSITAIDRSAPMIKLAKKRNREAVDTGKVKLITGSFTGTDLPPASFHKVVAFNVNFFWRSPEKELMLISKLLKPTGSLYIFHQAPVEIDKRSAGPVIQYLQQNGFNVTATILQKMKPTSVLCIIGKPLKK